MKTSMSFRRARPSSCPSRRKAYLYLSGTPFKALATGEFIEEQIFNWTYTDEQRAKEDFAARNPGQRNPYGALPQMRLLTYQMPDELLAIASAGEFDEFDLNEFFAATGTGVGASFKHKTEVQKWLDIIRGSYAPQTVESLKTGHGRHFPTRTFGCCLISSTLSGSCLTSPRAMPWRTCSPRSTTRSGTTTSLSSRRGHRQVLVLTHCRLSARLSEVDLKRKRLRFRAGNSPPA